uniref:Putative ovule protein n=1 Tax=Solanum chacoense TaxID=4108 RepID=A0A0V0H954_SOLCH
MNGKGKIAMTNKNLIICRNTLIDKNKDDKRRLNEHILEIHWQQNPRGGILRIGQLLKLRNCPP